MKLNVEKLRYLTKDDFRILVAIELGSRNHEIVPLSIISSVSKIHTGQVVKICKELCHLKLISRIQNAKYDGYRLGYGGYDYLAIHAFSSRDTVHSIGNQLGVGKESDIYWVKNYSGESLVMKIHRLGRTSFRTVKKNRDYLKHRKFASWTYFSRLAATKEYTFMKALYENGFPVPKPIDHNRHIIVMSAVNGYPLYQINHIENPGKIYSKLMNLILKFAENGLIHGDFNEFNIIIEAETESPIVIDFPQMVSIDHPNAEELFNRDVDCIKIWFKKRYAFESVNTPNFHTDINRIANLDSIVQASGFTKKMQKELEEFHEPLLNGKDSSDEDGSFENPEESETELNTGEDSDFDTECEDEDKDKDEEEEEEEESDEDNCPSDSQESD